MIPLLVVALLMALLALLLTCREQVALVKYNTVLRDENSRVHSLWNDLQYSSAKRLARVNKHLSVATVTLQDIANQNHGQQTFEIWARKRATDAVAFIEKDKS